MKSYRIIWTCQHGNKCVNDVQFESPNPADILNIFNNDIKQGRDFEYRQRPERPYFVDVFTSERKDWTTEYLGSYYIDVVVTAA